MWCCFTAHTVIEPTVVPKPLAAEVSVAKKPVTLMFRLPSDEKEPDPVPPPVPKLVGLSVPAPEPPTSSEAEEDVQNEVVNDSTCNNPCVLILALSVLAVLYMCMLNNERDNYHIDL